VLKVIESPNHEHSARKHIRIRLRTGVQAKVSVMTNSNHPELSREAPVLLNNLSPGGIQFVTHLRFPICDQYALRFLIAFGEWEFSVVGHVVWRRKSENQFVYGCSFVPDSHLSRAIVRALGTELQTLNPQQHRIHELYRQMTEARPLVKKQLDARG